MPVAVTSRSGFDESVHFGAVVALGADGDDRLRRRRSHAWRSTRGRRTSRCRRRRWSAPGCACPPSCWRWCAPATTARRAPRRVRGDPGRRRPRRASAGQHARPAARHRVERDAVLRAGGGPHAAAAELQRQARGDAGHVRINGWPIDPRYLRSGAPAAASASRATIDELAGEPRSHVGVDGCGAPAHVIVAARPGAGVPIDRHGRSRRGRRRGLRGDDRASRRWSAASAATSPRSCGTCPG